MAKRRKSKSKKTIGGWKYKLGRGRPTVRKLVESVYETNKEYIDKHLEGIKNKKRAKARFFYKNFPFRLEKRENDNII